MKIYFNIICSFILIVCLVTGTMGLCGCGNKDNSREYSVYYVNALGTALVAVPVKLDGIDGTQSQIEKLLDEMNTAGKKSKYTVAKPENVVLEHWTLDGNNVYIYYTASYKEMSAATEVLYRAAVVKTLSQADGVEHITFYVDNAPATYANGNVIGMMSASDFIDDADGKSDDMKWGDLKLYFANAKGNKLVPVTVSVAYNKNVPVERVIVEQLIKGPSTSGYYRTLPENTKLLGISITDGTCYVNLDATFLNEMVNASEMIPVYSIVNSLCELGTVNQVQILVNGESNKMYRESVSLETKFMPNLDIVQTTSQTQPATQQATSQIQQATMQAH